MSADEGATVPIDERTEARAVTRRLVTIGPRPSRYVGGVPVAGPGDLHVADLLRAAATYLEARGALDHEVAAVLWRYDGDRGYGTVELVLDG